MKMKLFTCKRCLFFFASAIIILSASSKTTYIPSYWSYLKIYQYEGDSISGQNIFGQLETTSKDGLFRITIVHEDITREKVKAIKRAKAAAGWSVVAAAFSGISASLGSVYYKNSIQTYVNMRHFENSLVLAKILQEEASEEERLSIDYFIDNLSNNELMVSDLERGLTWYILPHSSLQFNLNNPGIEHLRISNINQTNIQYADILAANTTKKETIEWEDDECWIRKVSKFIKDEKYVEYTYYYISKTTFESRKISLDEVKQIKKSKE